MAQIECNFVSYSLEYGVDITVTLPTISPCDLGEGKKPCHTPPAKYPVLYLLHGKGNDYKSWLRYTSVERLAEEQRIAVVTFSCGNKFYMNSPNHENYFDFLEEELPEFVCGNFPISPRVEDRYIAGLSMGGYGTLLHALRCPEHYCAFGAFSAPVHEVQQLLGSGAADLLKQLDETMKKRVQLPRAYLACGMNDFLYPDNADLHKAFVEHGVEHVWNAVPGYEHEWKFWDMEIEKFLNWLLWNVRTDYYAKLPIHKV